MHTTSNHALQVRKHSSRIRFLRFFKSKKTRLVTFFEAAFQKKRNPEFEVSDFADFSLYGISTKAQK